MSKAFIFLASCFFIVSCQRMDPLDTKDLFYLNKDGSSMPVYVFGNVQSEVFIFVLHGGPGGNGLEYRVGAYKDKLESNYAMVYYDQRAQGMSVGHENPSTFTIDLLAEDVYAVAKLLKFKYGEHISIFLLGHSWGGTLGSQVLIESDFQDIFSGWIEVDGAHNFPLMKTENIESLKSNGNDQIKLGNSIQFWDQIIDTLSKSNPNDLEFNYINSLGFEAEARLLLDDQLDSDPAVIIDGLVTFLFINNSISSYTSGYFANLNLFNKGLLDLNLSNQLKAIRIPSLFLWGKYDMVVSPTLAYDAYENIGSADKFLHIFERSGHSPMINEPDEFVDQVSEFVDQFK